MCGIAAVLDTGKKSAGEILAHLELMNRLQRHRGPDGEGYWVEEKLGVGMGHVRLSIIDIERGQQPMSSGLGTVVSYNGEIYNYKELRAELSEYQFKTQSDTEVILAAYEKWGTECLARLRGMFAFAIWDSKQQRLFVARDRFGIKPLYYTSVGSAIYLASEAKALLPFLPEISINPTALAEYLKFQFVLGEKTLIEGITEIPPAHYLTIYKGNITTQKYWEIYYDIEHQNTDSYFIESVRERVADSVEMHLRSDAPVGAYISGGRDSAIISTVAKRYNASMPGFTGRFGEGPAFDESSYARDLASKQNIDLKEVEITSEDFIDNIRKVIFHLDFPVAGPGAFPQFMVSKLASNHCKVVLGGQGGDELFGGYARYLIAYFEQCIKGAIEGTLNNGNFIVTYESIIGNLGALREYVPLLKKFWSEGLFESIDKRYFKLIDRSGGLDEFIHFKEIESSAPEEAFSSVFWGNNVGHASYFDLMTHFDFKTLLPALLQVEDRMSMAHGLEARVPFLDHPLVELSASIPSSSKFKDGKLKRVLREAFDAQLPDSIAGRRDKMGFPVPLDQWAQHDIKDFLHDTFGSQCAQERGWYNANSVLNNIENESRYSRALWGVLSLELWCQEIQDKSCELRKLSKG